jgi:transcriptional regulator with PAS, ATPase and Fis domain
MFAQAIHNSSKRAKNKFVAVNCAAIVPSLVESELFGYEEGTFTGAQKGGKLGLFEIANKGTLFLDEIGELGLQIQAKLLRVLQEGKVRKIGASREMPIDVRIIVATNRDLMAGVREKTFREDLYYRLNVVNINVPPLRMRGEDILLIAQEYLSAYSKRYGKYYNLDEKAAEALINYNWPGNIRELRNVIESSINMCDENKIMISHLPEALQRFNDEKNTGTLSHIMKVHEKNTLMLYLKRYGNSVENKKQIARELNISLATLYNKIKMYNIV